LARERSPLRKRALKLWLDSGRTKKPKQIAEELGISDAMVRKWKSLDKWEEQPDKRRRGAPEGNSNAKGNKGGPGGPVGNDKAVKHGLFRKFLPDDPETMEIFDATEELSSLDMLWTSIRILWTNIVRSQKIMFVTDKDEMIKELKKRKYEVHDVGKDRPEQFVTEEEYEFQFSWDRQATALNAQSQAMSRLASKVKQYEDMIRTLPSDEVQEEHRLRVEKLKVEVKALTKDANMKPVVIKDDLHE
jgi:uncharacterized protein YjcR